MRSSPSKIALMTIFVFAITLFLSCADNQYMEYSSIEELFPSTNGSSQIVYGTPVTYEGEIYRTVIIGSQTWFQRNLNYAAKGSKCYDNDPANCATYGRLYKWATAMNIDEKYIDEKWGGSDVNHKGICPKGWHIPSDAEWTTLTNFVGNNVGDKLKATSGWKHRFDNSPANGTDTYGFSALPSGWFNEYMDFENLGHEGCWWTASEYDNSHAYERYMGYYFEFGWWPDGSKHDGRSVRCIKD